MVLYWTSIQGDLQVSYFLTANFSSDIRELMDEFVGEIQNEGFSVMGRDQVLKTCLLLTENNHKFQLKNFSKTNINKVENNWEAITDKVYLAVNLLKEFGYTNRLSSAYILSVVSYYLFEKQLEKVTLGDKQEILKFVRNAQIASYFTTALDGKLDVMASVVKESRSFEEVNQRLEKHSVQPLKITNDDVERMMDAQYGNPAVLPILQVLYPNLDYKNSKFHIDHIYPKSKFNKRNTNLDKKYHTEANFLFNLQLLEGEENMQKKAKDPELWLGESSSEEISAYKERNYIDTNFLLNWDNIEEFEKLRKAALLDRLKSIFISNPGIG